MGKEQGKDAKHLSCTAVLTVDSLLITTDLWILEWGKGILSVHQTKKEVREVEKDELNLSLGSQEHKFLWYTVEDE